MATETSEREQGEQNQSNQSNQFISSALLQTDGTFELYSKLVIKLHTKLHTFHYDKIFSVTTHRNNNCECLQ